MKYPFTVLAMLLAAASWSTYANAEPTLPDDLHFKCFHVQGGKQIKKKVDLEDQFGKQKNKKVHHAAFLCAPVKKCVKDDYDKKKCDYPQNFTDAKLDGKHLKCYFITPPGKPVGKEVTLTDQFIKEDVKVGNAHLLCTPADKKVKKKY
jgi:hypothetical protein